MKWMKLFPELLLFANTLFAQGDDGLKVFISVDMEGISGVVVSSECSRSGKDFGSISDVSISC